MILALKNILFTLVVPGTVGVYLPLILARGRDVATDFFLGLAIVFFVIGGSIYSWCVFDFASFGKGTPAPIDAPKKGIVVACCFYSFVVFFEEPILKRRFGIEYEQYCAQVPRWLFR